MPLAAQGEFALVRKTLEKALDTAGQPVSGGTMAHDHEVYMALTEAAMELRDLDGLQTYAPLLAEVAGRDDHKLYLAMAYRALGVLHRLEGKAGQAETMLHQGLALFRELGGRWQMARTLVELAELELGRPRKKAKARQYYAEALGLFESMQALPHADRTRAAMITIA
jgi:tetratricopeptide (TPR) repeat protein